MRKVLGVIVVVVVAAGLVAPRFVGIKTEAKLQDYATNFEARVGMKAELKDYKRGWFSSTAMLVLKDNDAANDTYTFGLTIKHGPVIFNGLRPSLAWGQAHYEAVIPADMQKKLDTYFANSKQKPKMNGDIRLTLSDKVGFNFDLPEGNYKDSADPKAPKFDWKALSTDFSFNVKDNQYAALAGMVKFGGIVISGPGDEGQPIALKVNPINLDFDFAQYKKGSKLWVGNSSFTIDSVSLSGTPKGTFDLTGLMAKASVDIKDKFINETLEFKMDKFTGNGVNAGPIGIQLSFNKIEAEALNQYLVAMEKAGKQPSPEQVQTAILPVVKGGVEIALDKFDVNLDGKSLKAQGKFILPASPEIKDLMADGPGLMKKISLDLTIDAPVDSIRSLLVTAISLNISTQLNSQASGDAAATPAPAKMTDAQIAEQAKAQVDLGLTGLIEKGVVAQKGDNYSIHAVIKDGIFYLNDKQFADLRTIQKDNGGVNQPASQAAPAQLNSPVAP
jgi:uncharacterized protein YdgA (DUF945 family)